MSSEVVLMEGEQVQMVPAVDAADKHILEVVEDLVFEDLERITWSKVLLFASEDLLKEALVLILGIGLALTLGSQSLLFLIEELVYILLLV